jgi:hypothetical protein
MLSGVFVALVCAAPWTSALAATPRTDRVVASFGTSRLVAPSDRFCTGEDGEYMERHDEFRGSITSTDPRLTGTLTVKADLLVNLDTGDGTIHGTWEILDPSAGSLKLTGRFNGVVTALLTFKGLASANIVGAGGGVLVANLSVEVVGDTALGNVGFPLSGSLADPAVIQTGSCSGGFGPAL